MPWFFLALAAPALWSVSNHIDKYLLGKYFRDGAEGALLIFSSVVAFAVLPIIYFFHPTLFAIQPSHVLLMVFNGMMYIVALIPYMYAMQKDEASTVAPLFQLVAVFGYLFGVLFLDEHLSGVQLLAALLILAGAIFLSLDLNARFRFKGKVFGLMCLSSLILAGTTVVFKYVAIEEDFWTTVFWEYVGIALVGCILFFCISHYRRQFLSVFKEHTLFSLSVNSINETVNIVAKLAMNFATLLVPLALVLIVNSLQPVFVFVYGLFLTIFFPSFGKENITKKNLVQKGLAIIVVCAGAYLIQS